MEGRFSPGLAPIHRIGRPSYLKKSPPEGRNIPLYQALTLRLPLSQYNRSKKATAIGEPISPNQFSAWGKYIFK